MKKKILIASIIILVIFITALILSLRRSAIKEEPLFTPEKAAQQTQDDKISAESINKIHEQYPWYSKIPIETKDYRIIYDFEKQAFRIRLLNSNSKIIKQTALDSLKAIGVDLNQFEYYYLETEFGFENLLR